MAQNKPAHEVRLGKIRVTIWPNRSPNQGTWYSVTVSRSYKDGDAWKETSSFRRDDLPVVARAIDMAYAWIWGQERPAHPVDQEEYTAEHPYPDGHSPYGSLRGGNRHG